MAPRGSGRGANPRPSRKHIGDVRGFAASDYRLGSAGGHRKRSAARRQDSTLGIIGGNGWLGHAMARAALAAGGWHPSQLMLSCRSDRRGPVDLPGVRWTRDNQELVDGSQLIV